jgi:hypothetical protein
MRETVRDNEYLIRLSINGVANVGDEGSSASVLVLGSRLPACASSNLLHALKRWIVKYDAM